MASGIQNQSPSILRRFMSDVHIPCQPCGRTGKQKSTYGVCDRCKEVMCETCFSSHTLSCFSGNLCFTTPSENAQTHMHKHQVHLDPSDVKISHLHYSKASSTAGLKVLQSQDVKTSAVVEPTLVTTENEKAVAQSIVSSNPEGSQNFLSTSDRVQTDDVEQNKIDEILLTSECSQDDKQRSLDLKLTVTPQTFVPQESEVTLPQYTVTLEEASHKRADIGLEDGREIARLDKATRPLLSQNKETHEANGITHLHVDRKKCLEDDEKDGGVKAKFSQDTSNLKDSGICKVHDGESIDSYCQKHEVLICKICVKLEHKKCGVNKISEISKDFRSSGDFETIVASLNSLHENVLQVLKTNYDTKQKLLKNKENVLEQITDFRTALDQFLDKWETKMKKEAETMFNDITMKQESLLSTSKKMASGIEKHLEDLNREKTDAFESKLFIHATILKGLVEEYMDNLRKVQSETVFNTVAFHPNVAIQKAFHSSNRLGHMSVKQEPAWFPLDATTPEGFQASRKRASLKKIQSTEKITYENITALPAGHIDVKRPGDHNSCDIFGLAVINEDKIAAVDNTNLRVKIIDINKEKVVSDLKMSSAPWDITLLPKDRVAVTLPGKKVIQILSCSGSLSKVQQLKVDGYCHGIDYCDDHLVVAMNTYPSKIQIMKLNGQVKKSIQKDASGADLFMSCQDVAINKTTKDIYVSDTYSSNYCITRLNWEGKVTGVYKHTVRCETRGMVVLESGSVVVCYFDLNSVILVSPDLKSSRVILHKKDGLLRPRSLAVNTEQDSLFVGSKGKDCLDVFVLS